MTLCRINDTEASIDLDWGQYWLRLRPVLTFLRISGKYGKLLTFLRISGKYGNYWLFLTFLRISGKYGILLFPFGFSQIRVVGPVSSGPGPVPRVGTGIHTMSPYPITRVPHHPRAEYAHGYAGRSTVSQGAQTGYPGFSALHWTTVNTQTVANPGIGHLPDQSLINHGFKTKLQNWS